MIGRGSRESRKKRRIVKRVGREQYTEWVERGGKFTRGNILCMKDKLNSLADEKAYQKRQAEMEKERQKRMLRARMEFASAQLMKAPEPLKFYSAGSDDPEKDNERRKRRRSRNAEPQEGVAKMGNFSPALGRKGSRRPI